MFLQPTLSLLGIYNYDNTIFDGLRIPAGMDRDILISDLLMQSAELEVVYPSAPVLKVAISNFSKINFAIWQKMYDSTKFKYNPLWNVDGTTVERETGERRYHNEQSNEDKTTAVNSVNGYNGGTWQDSEKDAQRIEYGKHEDTTETPNITRETVRQGNIGVTKSTELIDSYRDTEQFNVYQFIIDAIISRFCLLIY